jgi:hypothetical protein
MTKEEKSTQEMMDFIMGVKRPKISYRLDADKITTIDEIKVIIGFLMKDKYVVEPREEIKHLFIKCNKFWEPIE